MKILERDGARIAYEVSGDGPPVVLGHSLLCNGSMWDGIVPVLARRHRVINVDLRGHRNSTAPRAFSLDELADDWLAIMDREGIRRAALIGLSMGGMTAMRVALRAPERVTSLGLLNTSADPEPPAKRIEYRLLAEIAARVGYLRLFEKTVERILLGKTALRARPELASALHEAIRRDDPHQLYFAVRAVAERDSIHESLRRIRCPALVIASDEDAAFSPLRAERIAGALPHARLEVLAKVGHLSAVEVPDRIAALLDGFLTETDTARARLAN